MQPPPHRPRHNETGRPQPFHQGLSADTGEKQVGISRRSPAVAIYWRSIATTSSSESSPRFVSLSSKTRFGNSSRSNVDCDDCARILFSCERFLGHVLRRRCHVQDIKSIAAEGAARRLAHRQRHHSVQAAIGCIAVQGPSAINGCPQNPSASTVEPSGEPLPSAKSAKIRRLPSSPLSTSKSYA